MDSTTVKRVLVVLGIVAIIVLAIAGIVRLAGGGDQAGPQETLSADSTLLDYDNDSSLARLTYEGEIVGREDYRELRFSISAKERRLEVIQGYNGSVLRKKVYRNDDAAYATFLRALDVAGFASSQTNELGDDHRGVCASGNRTIAELFQDDEIQVKLWSASCDRKAGTLAGRDRDLLRLFQAQFPDYRQLVRGVRL